MGSNEVLKKKAFEHNNEMTEKYKNEINRAIQETIEYGGKTGKVPKGSTERNDTSFEIIDTDSVTAISKTSKKTALLNFASYKHPGGGYMNGMMAQEEALCHSSFLYNVLSEKEEYYEYNMNNLNRGMYTDRALYTPDVIFENKCKIDVITCASPNKTPAIRYNAFSYEENDNNLIQRLEFIKNILEENNVEEFVAGAWGCGVFRQDPTVVAEAFYKVFKKSGLSKVIFAIPGGKNLKAFKEFYRGGLT